MTQYQSIIHKMPYGKDFLFVDSYDYINEDGALGYYHFDPEAAFYESHFPGNPITPGVILIETMAQIGLVGLGLYLIQEKKTENKEIIGIAFTETQVQFLEKVLPGEKVKVESKKVYFRLGKLKCEVRMYNEKEQLVCFGTMAGIIINK